MKRVLTFILAAVLFVPSLQAQQVSNQIGNIKDIPDQGNILKASLVLHDSEENMFWPLYEQYEAQLGEMKQKTITSLAAVIASERDSTEGFSVVTLLEDQRAEVGLKKEYFEKIASSTNGSVALQFLQGEALYDLLLKSKLYEQLQWNGSVWTPAILTDEHAKQTVYEFVLGVPARDTTTFRSLLADFDFYYSRAVGHQYVFFEHYIDNANGWTPFQCKKMGDNFLNMQLVEVKVKEDYFRIFSEAFSPPFATRLISLHEYFNMMSKLKVWSDYISIPD
jgi:hypothetical protein